MLVVISPAKTLDFETVPATRSFSQPVFLEEAGELVASLREMAPHELSALMSISDKLGVLNYDRYQTWAPPFSLDNAKQALLAFKGDVYTGLDAERFSEVDFGYAQSHLRILSGLYGLLRPLDLIQAYRLEMGTRLKNSRGAHLYHFWGEVITRALNTALVESGSDILVNLASNEYFKSVKPGLLRGEVIVPAFKELRAGQYKMISFSAKRARGMMAAYIVRRRLTEPEAIKAFDEDGYRFNESLSSGNTWVFAREP